MSFRRGRLTIKAVRASDELIVFVATGNHTLGETGRTWLSSDLAIFNAALAVASRTTAWLHDVHLRRLVVIPARSQHRLLIARRLTLRYRWQAFTLSEAMAAIPLVLIVRYAG